MVASPAVPAVPFFEIFLTLETEADTRRVAKKLAECARPGDAFALFGDLGVGKTAFARHFIRTLLPGEDVPSPTFTLAQTYDAPGPLRLWHFDFYRLKKPREARELGLEEAFEDVSLMEWPENIGSFLPKTALRLHFRQLPQSEVRHLTLQAPENWHAVHTLPDLALR